ncbi:hypothetical protein EMIHUDRAFT_466447, partial [Emiliania huxleyi CCMP1516]|uniref:Uncharacterized protein n=2 Tax=Emiliania huxleyi TaxID=2903 RepID=A0A0D3KY43_EMIH1
GGGRRRPRRDGGGRRCGPAVCAAQLRRREISRRRRPLPALQRLRAGRAGRGARPRAAAAACVGGRGGGAGQGEAREAGAGRRVPGPRRAAVCRAARRARPPQPAAGRPRRLSRPSRGARQRCLLGGRSHARRGGRSRIEPVGVGDALPCAACREGDQGRPRGRACGAEAGRRRAGPEGAARDTRGATLRQLLGRGPLRERAGGQHAAEGAPRRCQGRIAGYVRLRAGSPRSLCLSDLPLPLCPVCELSEL